MRSSKQFFCQSTPETQRRYYLVCLNQGTYIRQAIIISLFPFLEFIHVLYFFPKQKDYWKKCAKQRAKVVLSLGHKRLRLFCRPAHCVALQGNLIASQIPRSAEFQVSVEQENLNRRDCISFKLCRPYKATMHQINTRITLLFTPMWIMSFIVCVISTSSQGKQIPQPVISRKRKYKNFVCLLSLVQMSS